MGRGGTQGFDSSSPAACGASPEATAPMASAVFFPCPGGAGSWPLRCPSPRGKQSGRGASGWCSDMTSTHEAWRHAGVRFLLSGECICPTPNPAACGGLQSMERALGVGSRKLARCAPMPKMQPTRCSAACRSRKRPGRRRHMVGGVAFMHVFRSRGLQERVAPESGPAAALIPPFLPCLREAAVAAEQRRHASKDRVSVAGVSRAGART